jgi:scyllo-inosamine-4-phosphate amidinotransferase 1
MKIHSYNEWDTLKEIVVGTATNANWPLHDPVFALESKKTTWHETSVPSGPVPQWIIDETNEDLDGLVKILQQADVTVHRPKDLDFVGYDGMYNYCPRDRLLIAGNCIIDPVMMYPSRDIELAALGCVIQQNELVTMPRHWGMVLDAANICRLDDTWLFLESSSGNRAAAVWLQARFPEIHIELCNFYAGVHIDSTVVPLREGVVMLNASRVTPDTVPKCLRSWTQIWIDDCVPQQFHQYPYASKWIGMNTLSINPDTVIVDATQTDIIKRLEAMKFTVIPHTLRHSRTLGGGFHCVTLDTWRQND